VKKHAALESFILNFSSKLGMPLWERTLNEIGSSFPFFCNVESLEIKSKEAKL